MDLHGQLTRRNQDQRGNVAMFSCAIICSIIGIRKASVFPVPVCAVARTSFPSKAGGIADA